MARRTQRLECKGCSCWERCSFKIRVACSSLSATLWWERKPQLPNVVASYTTFVESISYAVKWIRKVWQIFHPGTTTNPIKWKLPCSSPDLSETPGYHFIHIISADFPNAFFGTTRANLVTYSKSCFSSMLSALTSHVTYLSWSVQCNSTHQT